jgi:ATP-dependent RNA helicase RhlE
MKFADYPISTELKKSIAEIGFSRPTDIQFKSIPAILKGQNILAIAQTGTGKTAAFAIPVIHRLQHKNKYQEYSRNIRCLVMLPTRELAIQITEVFNQLSKYTRLNILCLHGGVEQSPQIDQLEGGVDILITTPGRMFDLVSQGYINLETVEILVLDEADQMLDLGFIKDIRDVIRLLPQKRQTLFFSATIDKEIKKLAYDIVLNPIRIHISPKNPVSKNVTHTVVYVNMDDKRFFLERIVNEAPQSKILVFVRTKVRAERVHQAMERVGIASVTMHGDKEQDARLSAMEDFKNDKVKLLIATDISARGIDIAKVDYVINYDLPDLPENYVHRVGRTGRGVLIGHAVSFCSPEEKQLLKEIEEFIGGEIDEVKIDKTSYEATVDFSKDASNNWSALINEVLKDEEIYNKKRKKKKK